MEIDPEANESSGSGGNFLKQALGGGMFGGSQQMEGEYGEETESGGNFMSEFMKAMPGIDEATAFGEVLNQIDKYSYDLVIFDTAPTGHTMRLLKFPQICENGLKKLIELKEKFGGVLKQAQQMMQTAQGQSVNPDQIEDKLFHTLNQLKQRIEKVNKQFQDDNFTTFVAVCIPEKLSVYETSRLMEELARQDIDLSNIIVNQVCIPNPTNPCEQCTARRHMQNKYLQQIKDIFNLHHVVHVPQGRIEVIGEELLV
jgi:arsenite-transporting ATPase